MFQVYSKVIQLYILMCVYTSIPFQILFSYSLLQDTEHISLCYTVGPCCLALHLKYPKRCCTIVVYCHRILFLKKPGIHSLFYSAKNLNYQEMEWLAKCFTSEKSITHAFLIVIQQAVN